MASIFIRKGREKSILQHHPWIFSGSVERVEGSPCSGETVQLLDHKGEFLAWAAYSPVSQICARIWSWAPEEKINAGFFENQLRQAISLRDKLMVSSRSSAFRLVYAESDGIPGLIVDQYNDSLIVQILSTGPEFWRETLIKELVHLTGLNRVFERSDVDVRRLEGLQEKVGPLCGEIDDDPLEIRENGLSFKVDVKKGHKTGFYLDQRENRSRIGAYAKDREILNCFSYTGAFAVYALAFGAKKVISIDSSADMLKLGEENIRLNGLDEDQVDWVRGDVFQMLRRYRDQSRFFDLIILDPPKFAPTLAQAERAARGYKDINLLAFKLLRPGGILFTFSCSGGISPSLFQKIVAGAALDAGVKARIIEIMGQAPDHPVALNFPEGAYLKGLVCSL